MTKQTILVADDDASIRLVLSQALTRAGYEVLPMSNITTMWNHVSRGEGDLLITDVMMPDGNAFDILPKIKKQRPDLPFIVMSAQNTFMTAVKANEAGAFEYLPKPFDLAEVTNTAAKALQDRENKKKKSVDVDVEDMPLVGRSAPMQDIYRTMARLIQTDLTVMISGESGTGKEVVARALHEFGKRKNGPFNAINMAAIPQDLIESELFGHEKGAFTGANARARGHFELSARGTLFLDEIGDMPMAAQTRLLRVLQEGEFTRVGGRETLQTDVRIIAATHRDLNQLIRQGLFREDLYYRLNVVQLRMPALRERPEDISDLVRHFIEKYSEDTKLRKSISPEALVVMAQHTWPGNVRELENLVHRFVALYPEEAISPEMVAAEIGSTQSAQGTSAAPMGEGQNLHESVERHLMRIFAEAEPNLPADDLYHRIVDEIEVPLLEITMSACNGNQVKAAQLLGLNRNTLRKKLNTHHIRVAKGLSR
ncbi:nitrogen regulation protein NR(I) [Maritalea sp.]|uniref:nitrogen regulation protein NR(I) n=1 Tax=Maritalea sp. TaxID=2003361 RepID=UPI003EF33807